VAAADAEVAVDDQAILDEVEQDAQPAFQEAATAIREPAADDLQAGADYEVEAADVLDSQDADATGPDDEDPFRP
jgi:hypothetical protein